MALATCRDCGREVSTRAHHCVHCGRPWPSGNCCSPIITGLLVGVVALTAVGGAIFVRQKCRQARECRVEQMERGSGTRVESVRHAEDAPQAAPAPADRK